MIQYRAAVIGCSRIGGFIDNEVAGHEGLSMQPPSSHGGGYYVSDRTELIGCSDLREDVMEQFGQRYDIPKSGQYTDYKKLIDQEQPDIVSIATQPEHRADIAIYAAENGVKAIYAEKALAASLEQADAMMDAVEKNRVSFNMGTNRRWSRHYEKMKEIIDSGELGPLKSLIIHANSSLFNSASHTFDTINYLNNDSNPSWVQGRLHDDSIIDGNIIRDDPIGEGVIGFENEVICYALQTGLGSTFQAICENGYITIKDDGEEFDYRGPGPLNHKGVPTIIPFEFPEVKAVSTVVNIVEDLAHSLDTGRPPKGGVKVARASLELSFGIIESHLSNGAKVDFPIKRHNLKLDRVRAPRKPKYQA